MKKSFFLFFICSAFIAEAQKIPDYGLYNVYISDSGKFIHTQINPTSGTVSVQTRLFYSWLGHNVIHEQQGGFSGKLLNGIYEEYDQEHHLTVQGGFRNGLKNGTWKTWGNSGLLTGFSTWDAGVRNGKFATYDPSGKEKQSGTYSNNQLNGKVINNAGTDSAKIVQYREGKVIPPKEGTFLKRINIFRKKQAKPAPVKTP